MRPNPAIEMIEQSRYRPTYNPSEEIKPYACDGCTYDGPLTPACEGVQEDELARQQLLYNHKKPIVTSEAFFGQCPKLYEQNRGINEQKRNRDPVESLIERMKK